MFRPTLALFREVVNKVQWLIMLHKCSYNARIRMLNKKYITIFKTWKWVTSVRKYRGTLCSEVHIKMCHKYQFVV
jgi:hypothetical protein